jgi:hypothetical protein
MYGVDSKEGDISSSKPDFVTQSTGLGGSVSQSAVEHEE